MKALLLLAINSILLLEETAQEPSSKIKTANLAFAWTWFDYLRKTPGNVAFSPLTAHSSLAAIYQGAEGSTAKNMAEKLLLPDKIATAHGYKEVFDELSDNKEIITIANKIYTKQGQELKKEFQETINEYFSTEIESLDFSEKSEAASTINSWAASKTNNSVTNLVSSSDLASGIHLALVNAVHLRGKWKNMFNERYTEEQPFYVDENTTVKVPTMFAESYFKYKVLREEGFKVIELPFVNENFILYMVLPLERYGVLSVEDSILHVKNNEALLFNGLVEQPVRVWLPKFKLQKSINLKEALEKQFNLGELCTNSSDLTGIRNNNEKPLFISRTFQKVAMELRESGFENAPVIVPEIPLRRPVEEFKFDHPFLFEIRYKKGGHLSLICGRISNPLEM